MPTWTDIFSLFATALVCAGTVFALTRLARQISSSIQSTRQSLEARGISVSESGVSIATNKRFDREHYLDATQRGLFKAFNAASFGKPPAEKSDRAR